MKLSNRTVKKEQVTFSGVLKLIFQTVRSYKSAVTGIIFLGILSAIASLIGPKIFQYIIDGLPAGTLSFERAALFAILSAAAILLSAIFTQIAEKLSFFIATQVEDTWRYTSLLRFYQLPLKWHDQHDSGEIGAKIDRGGSAIWSILYEIFGQNLIVLFITLVFILGYITWQYPSFILLFILPIPVYIAVTYIVSNKIAAMQIGINKIDHRANRTFYDGVGNLRYVKTFGKEYSETQKYATIWDAYHRAEYNVIRLWAYQSSLQKLIETITRAILIIVCIIAVKSNTLTIGELVLLVTYQQLSYSPLEKLNQLFTRLRRVTKRASHLFDIAAEIDPLADAPDAVNLSQLKREIRFEDVHFEYSKKLHTLHEISLSIKPGTTTAIVGRSGAGKTTLAMLLARFYDPDAGKITWDGIDLRKTKRSSLRNKLTLILQDTTLFNRSIADNIAYGKPSASQSEIEKAAKLAHAHEFIKTLPKGYHSIVGERGVRLSGGQRQRIAIARALLGAPELLIMDEATSHLDSETELAIKEAIEYLRGKHTQVIIAHRLSTVQHADNIVLMDNGRILAQGKHETLLAHPLYRKLCALQLHK